MWKDGTWNLSVIRESRDRKEDKEEETEDEDPGHYRYYSHCSILRVFLFADSGIMRD